MSRAPPANEPLPPRHHQERRSPPEVPITCSLYLAEGVLLAPIRTRNENRPPLRSTSVAVDTSTSRLRVPIRHNSTLTPVAAGPPERATVPLIVPYVTLAWTRTRWGAARVIRTTAVLCERQLVLRKVTQPPDRPLTLKERFACAAPWTQT